jgi:hypothetical protein
MRSIQKIFDIVISKGFYKDFGFNSSGFMCISLWLASYEGVITKEEERKVIAAIEQYVYPRFTLSEKLKEKGIEDSFANRLKIYKDWKNRPT